MAMAALPGNVASYNIAPGESADAAAVRRKMALALMMEGMSTDPIRHWAQGAARIGQSIIGGMELNRMDQKDQEDKAQGRAALMALLGGNAEASSTPAQTSPVNPVAPRTFSQNRVYSANEPSPLDPPSGKDRDLAVRTILAEAGNQGPQGMQAVGNVIRNRAVAGNYGGDTPSQVVTAQNQFEPWNTQAGRQRMASIDPNSPQYQQAALALDKAYTGDDPTKGATNFFAPKAQAALGRPVPSWAQTGGQDIGDHRFFGGAQGPVGAPVDQPRGGMTPERRNQLISVLAGTPGIGGAIAQNLVMKQLDREQNAVRPLTDAGERAARGIPADDKNAYQVDATGKISAVNPQPYAVNINNQAESEFSKKGSELRAKRFDEVISDASTAPQMKADIAMLTDLGAKIGTGKEAEIKAAIGPWANALGIDVKNLGEIQAYEAIVNRLAPALRVKGSGAQSDFELQNFLKSLPKLGNTPEGNAIASQVLNGLYENKLKAAQISSDALDKKISAGEAEKMIRELPDPMQGWREFNKKSGSSGQPSVDDLIKKYSR